MSYKLIACCALVLFTLSCKNKANITIQEIEDGQKLVSIDASWFELGDDYGDRFEVDYVPLETNANALVGVIDEIKVVGDRVFLLDPDVAKALLIYNQKGKFINKISATGGGPEEISRINDFTINRKKKEIIISDLGLRKLMVYDFDGNLIRVERNELWFTYFEWIQGNSYLFYLSHYSVDENNGDFGPLIVLGDINGNVEKEYFKIDNRPSNLTVVEVFKMSHNGEEILFNKKFDENIYTLDEKNKLLSKLKINFGNLSIGRDYREIKVNNYMQYENENPFAQLRNAYSTNSSYAIGYTNPVKLPGVQVNLQAVIPKDGSDAYLYVPTNRPDEGGVMLPSIRASNREYFFGLYDADDLLSANRENAFVISENYPELNLNQIQDTDNPIFVRIKVKDEE